MSTPDVEHKEYIASSILFALAAVLMATPLLKTPAHPVRYLFLATPYVFLWSLWRGSHNVHKRIRLFKSGSADESQVIFQRLRSAVQMQTIFGLAGIGVALAMGFVLGRLACR